MSSGSIGSSGASAPSTETSNVQSQTGSNHSGSGKITAATKITSVEDLRKKAPQVYNQMLIGIGTNVCKDMEHSQQRIKEIMRKDEAQAAGG
jgi:hypothetical protein